jgi:hypothetical protein
MLNTWSISMALSKSSPPQQKSSKMHVDGCEQLIYSFNRWSTSQYIPGFWGFQRSIWWFYHHFTIMLPSFYHHFAPIKICFSLPTRWGSLDPSLAASLPPSSFLPSFLLSFLPLPTSFASSSLSTAAWRHLEPPGPELMPERRPESKLEKMQKRMSDRMLEHM